MEFKSVGLEFVLADKSKCPYTDIEKIIKCKDKNIKCYFDKYNSYRFVYYQNNVPISGLQIMKNYQSVAYIANAFTKNDFRRQGFASLILKEVKLHFEKLFHSTNLSSDGKSWVSAHFINNKLKV